VGPGIGVLPGIEPAPPTSRLRRPTSLVIQGQQLFVANRDAGSISVISTQSHQIQSEWQVGQRLSCMARLHHQNILLAVDEKQHRLHALKMDDTTLSELSRIDTGHTPVHVIADRAGEMIAVACLWARQIQIFQWHDNDSAPSLESRFTVDLPFNPRLQWLAPDDRHLLVADSHGGYLARINIRSGVLEQIFDLHVHSIRGLALNPGKTHLLITHQLLNNLAATERQRVFWGTVMENLVRAIPLADLLKPNTNPPSQIKSIAHWLQYPIGQPGNAAGDPGAMVVAANGEVFVCLCGTNQVAHDKNLYNQLTRHTVQQHPVALALDENQNFLYVANQFSDSISVLNRSKNKITQTISLGPTPPLTRAQQGETLFYDARLSLHGWYSCHSCHPDGHTNGLLNENMSDLKMDSPKQVLSLLGTGKTQPWAWTGRLSSLQQQVHKSIHVTMQGKESPLAHSDTEQALVAYLQNLPPAPALNVARKRNDITAIAKGKAVFKTFQCHACHPAPHFTSESNYDVGIHDEHGMTEFNPPSLVGISQRQRFFHDNRARRLSDVFTVFQHPFTGKNSSPTLSKEDIHNLIEYLNRL